MIHPCIHSHNVPLLHKGFLQLDDILGQHDPRVWNIGDYHETLEGHDTITSHMLQNKTLNMHHQFSHYTRTIKNKWETESRNRETKNKWETDTKRHIDMPTPKCVLMGIYLCTRQFSVAIGNFQWHKKTKKEVKFAAFWDMMMTHSLQTRIFGKVNSCMLVGGCRDWFLMRTPHCTLDR